jgi:signal peptidase I
MTNKPRKWWIAGLLSLINPGLGQIYNGQGRKGVIILALSFLSLPVIMLCLDHGNVVLCLVLFAVLGLSYYCYAIADAIIVARRLRLEYILKKYNRAIVYIGIIIAVALVNSSLFASGISPSEYIKKNYIQAFKIPAGSMKPTIVVGDQILVDRRPTAQDPKPGDVIVFEYPVDPAKDFIKRVIAVGGDTVEIRDKELLINGEPKAEPYVIHSDTKTIPAKVSPRDNFGPVTVPKGSFFVIGDNRDESYDSRFWGFVEQARVKGTAKIVYWSWDSDAASIRWNRIGTKIQ